MEQAKKRIRICLICVVVAAILLGIFYVAGTKGENTAEESGTLVSARVAGGYNEYEWNDFIYQR